MTPFVFLLVSLGLLSACSRDEAIKIPEVYNAAVPAGAETGGDAIVDQTPGGDTSVDESTVPAENTLPIPPEMNPPSTGSTPQTPAPVLRVFFNEPHEVIGEVVSFYNRDTGLWPEGWKTSAYAMWSLIDYMNRTKTSDFAWILDNSFRKHSFVQNNFEDNASWGISWILAYDLTKDSLYLDSAKTLHDQIMSAAWDQNCGGGLYATQDKATKSTASNLLALRLSAMLYQRLPNDQIYKASADKLWAWFSNSALMGSKQILANALNASDCSLTQENPNIQNQGLFIAALSSIASYDNSPKWIGDAKLLALASLNEFRNGEGFIDDKHPLASTEQALHKGIFVQALASLYLMDKDETWTRVINQNADSAWSKSKGSGGLIAYNWHAAFDQADSSRQTSAALLFNALINKALEKNVALNGDTRTSSICYNEENAAKAFDGSSRTKWCGGMINGNNHLSVDLGTLRTLKTVRILHAGAGGESRTLNTKDFELQISSNGADFSDIAVVRDNQSSLSFHKVDGRGRYLRLRFTDPGADSVGRIYEISVE